MLLGITTMHKCILGHWIFSKDLNAKCRICSGDKEYIKKLPIRNIIFKGIKVQFSKT